MLLARAPTVSCESLGLETRRLLVDREAGGGEARRASAELTCQAFLP